MIVLYKLEANNKLMSEKRVFLPVYVILIYKIKTLKYQDLNK